MSMKLTSAFEQWFDSSKVVDADGKPLVVYHGTASDFNAFSSASNRSVLNNQYQGNGFHFSGQPEIAGDYADAARNQFLNKEKAFALVDKNLPPLAAKVFKDVVNNGYDQAWEKPDAEVSAILAESRNADLDLNDLLDIAEWVDGTNYNKGREEQFDAGMIFGGSAKYLPDWVRDNAVTFGMQSALPSPAVMPVYLSATKVLKTSSAAAAKRAQAAGYDGVYYTGPGTVKGVPEWIVFKPEQVKSAIGNNGDFDAANPDIRFSMPDVNEIEDDSENDTEAPCP